MNSDNDIKVDLEKLSEDEVSKNTAKVEATEENDPVGKKPDEDKMTADSALTGIICFISKLVCFITTGIIEISVVALDAILSSGNRGFQALAGIGATLGYYVSLRYTWLLMASMDPGVGLSTLLGFTIEFAKIVLSYLGWGRSGGNWYFRLLAIVAIIMSIFATMSYSKNANNRIRMETVRGTDQYAAQQAQRDSLTQELSTINDSIAAKEQAASAARNGADATASKVSSIDPDVKANASAAKKAKDDQADAIQQALDTKIASYSPAWLAKNASEVSKWKEQARTDISALRTAGVNSYNEMTKAKDYDTAKNEVIGNATTLEGQAAELRKRKDAIISTLGTAASADNTQKYTAGYLSVFELPKTTEEGFELAVNLFFAIFLELFSAALVKAYKDFGDENSSLFGSAVDFAHKLRESADSLRRPNYGPATAGGYSQHSSIGDNLGSGHSNNDDDWIHDNEPRTIGFKQPKTDHSSSGGMIIKQSNLSGAKTEQVHAKHNGALKLDIPNFSLGTNNSTDDAKFKHIGQIDLLDVQRYAAHISDTATQNKSGEYVAQGIRTVAKALRMSPETAKKAHWYLAAHGKISVDDKAKRTYIPQ